MQIYLIRHGETDWNAQGRMQGLTDTPLNARGLQQAEQVAARLDEYGPGAFAALFSSPLQRAWRTAEVIGQRLGLEVQAEPRLIEHSVGPLEGLTADEIRDRFPEISEAWKRGVSRPRVPGEGTRAELVNRFLGWVEEARARHPEGRVLGVSHGGAMNAYLMWVVGADLDRRSPFWLGNGSLSIVDYREAWPRVLRLNDTCHLELDGADQDLARIETHESRREAETSPAREGAK